MRKTLAALCTAPLALLPLASPALASSTSQATAHFRPGSGLYLAGPGQTDGLSQLSGSVTFTQSTSGGTISVSGRVGNLAPNMLYVAVPYKDGICAPVAGVTAFPSGSFTTDGTGTATIPAGVTVNPAAINPAGTINVSEVHSVSIRQVVLTPVPLPTVPGYPAGVPAGTPVAPAQTPTVPNVAAVQGCDRQPVVR